MKIRVVAFFLLAGVAPAWADLEVVPAETPQVVFAGGPAKAALILRNPDGDRREQELSIRIFQLSSATAMPIGERQPWKKVQMLGGQTVIGSVPVTLPEIRAATFFRIEVSSPDGVVARLPILACPRDLLQRLAAFGGETPVGIYDPEARLKPLLHEA